MSSFMMQVRHFKKFVFFCLLNIGVSLPLTSLHAEENVSKKKAPLDSKNNTAVVKVTAPPNLWWQVLKGLGGIEFAYFWGNAEIKSHLKSDQKNREIATGHADQKGYKISLFTPPKASGWYFYPTFGYMSQQLAIADFKKTTQGQTKEGVRQIKVRCSDPNTGETFDCGKPISYQLNIQSSFIGARFGYGAVLSTAKGYLDLFTSFSAGFNALELRYVNAKLEQYSKNGYLWAFARSGAVGMTFGIHLPKFHTVFRVSGDWELYLNFRYKEPLEFKMLRYNEALEDDEMYHVKVPDAQYHAWNIQLSAAVVF